jgi:hypothetical protein
MAYPQKLRNFGAIVQRGIGGRWRGRRVNREQKSKILVLFFLV